MRTKLTALAVLGACLTGVTAATAAPIPVAAYTFATQADVDAFIKAVGTKCKKKLTGGETMSVTVGPSTNACAFDTGVVADSSDLMPDQELAADAALGANTPETLRKKAYLGVRVRSSATAGWELRVRPVARSWQLFRDPKGAGGPTLARSGKGKFIRTELKSNNLALRAFDFGSPTTQILARINNKPVATFSDAATDQPDGKRNGIVTGVKGTAAGTGVVGGFDNVTVRIPNPF